MNLDDLLAAEQPKTRVTAFKIDGVGELDIHELSAIERAAYFADVDATVKGEMNDDDFTLKWLWRLTGGRERAFDADRASLLREKLSQSQIEQILNTGVRFTDDKAIAAAKKR